MGCLQITTTAPKDIAERIAAVAVAERLAACAQVTGPVFSTFRWENAVDTATEWCCHLKTTQARWPALQARIRGLHTYELPEIIALPIVGGSAEYLAWIEEQVREESMKGETGRGERE